ncbi:argininosuccinate lyase [Desulfuribacillus stibiiarsenatis]|uniref:Argininosuccinate lyase n=1 Tax=Desulfuribacillus stibiiarsenatis TaxID=1390249 RepID=A0A1E5L9E9_9FIRM|nr:argininosuccinate lyase [Desulfuribacillus stibiiarsenatis]OEH86787.1 argininosuccinate lyase [Desulfuribacillus stibiiarsenatis]
MKLWGGRFTKSTHKLVDEFTASVLFDQKLWNEDIKGSIAHVTMLGKQGIIPQADAETIKNGLLVIRERIENDEFTFSVTDEDVHMNIEKALIEEIGPVGGKLHTGRSRNDQVSTDMHLFLCSRIKEIVELLKGLQQVLVQKAETNIDIVIPGYTHLQRAQPILFAHHMMAYFWMFQRDVERFEDAYKRADILPLGAGAMAGTTFPIDRQFVADQLGFTNIYENSLDAVSDRDYILEFLSAASITMMHLSRFCEELILWSSTEFQFIELDDAFCTGSSIMPQKKNPDVAELVRGKTGRVYGHLMSLLTIMKSLPLAYNKDLQEDKEGMFDVVETLKMSLTLFAPMIETMKVNEDVLKKTVNQDFANATDLADYLVRKHLPFRDAHEVIGKIVLHCIQNKKFLPDLTIEEYKEFSDLFDKDVYQVIDPINVVNARNVLGGTAKPQVLQAIEKAKILLG